MADYMHVYKNNPTGGGVNGTLVSEETELEPIESGALNAAENEESNPIKLAIRTEDTYQTTGNTVITPAGSSANKWALAPDNSGNPGTFGAYGASLTITSVITDVNTLFWAKAKAVNTEDPINDTSVDFNVVATIEAE